MTTQEPVTIVLLGKPVAWARPGGGKTGNRFTPEKQRANGAEIKLAAQQYMLHQHDAGMFEVPVEMLIRAEFQIPVSWSRKKKNAALLGLFHHGGKPDADNLAKQVNDALKGVVYSDDKLISLLTVDKRYSNQPKLVIRVSVR
jgi:Holliday junction resolvase RusA-like endonuclease